MPKSINFKFPINSVSSKTNKDNKTNKVNKSAPLTPSTNLTSALSLASPDAIAQALVDFIHALILQPTPPIAGQPIKTKNIWDEELIIHASTPSSVAPLKIKITDFVNNFKGMNELYDVHYCIMEKLINAQDYKSIAAYQGQVINQFFSVIIKASLFEKNSLFMAGVAEKILNLNFINRYCKGGQDLPTSNISKEKLELVVSWNLLGNYWDTLSSLIQSHSFDMFKELLSNDKLFYQQACGDGLSKINASTSPLVSFAFLLEENLDDLKSTAYFHSDKPSLSDDTALHSVYGRMLEFASVFTNSSTPLLLLSRFLYHYTGPKAPERIEALLTNFNYLNNSLDFFQSSNYLLGNLKEDFALPQLKNIDTALMLMVKKKFNFDINSSKSISALSSIEPSELKGLSSIFLFLANSYLTALKNQHFEASDINASSLKTSLERRAGQCLFAFKELNASPLNASLELSRNNIVKSVFPSVSNSALTLINLLNLPLVDTSQHDTLRNKIASISQFSDNIVAFYEKEKLELNLNDEPNEIKALLPNVKKVKQKV